MSKTYRRIKNAEFCSKIGRVKKPGFNGIVVDGEQIVSAVSCDFTGDVDVKNGYKELDSPKHKKSCKRMSAKYRRRKGEEIVFKEIKEI